MCRHTYKYSVQIYNRTQYHLHIQSHYIIDLSVEQSMDALYLNSLDEICWNQSPLPSCFPRTNLHFFSLFPRENWLDWRQLVRSQRSQDWTCQDWRPRILRYLLCSLSICVVYWPTPPTVSRRRKYLEYSSSLLCKSFPLETGEVCVTRWTWTAHS